MQTRKTPAWFKVKLVTMSKARAGSPSTPLAEPTWLMDYNYEGEKRNQLSLGKAWTKSSRSPQGYVTHAQALVAAQAHMDKGAKTIPADRRTFTRSWEDFLASKAKVKKPLRGSTLHSYQNIVRTLGRRDGSKWADRPVASFTSDEVLTVMTELEDLDRAASTINHYRRVLRAILGNEICREWPHLSEEPEESNGKLRFYDPDQVRRLTEEATCDTERTIFTLATQAGPRLSEILGLKVGNVDFEVGRVRFEDGFTATGGHSGTKSHQVRSVPMSDAVREVLWPLCQGRDKDAWVFPHGYKTDVPIDGFAVYRAFKAAAAKAGLPDIRFHELRHSFGTRAIRGFNIYEVQKMMGHARITTTERYLHYAPDPEGAAKITGLWADAASREDADVISIRRGS